MNFIFFSSTPGKRFQVFNTPHVSFFFLASLLLATSRVCIINFSLLIITKKCVPYVWFGREALLPVSAILIMETRSVCLACVCRRMGFGRRPIGLGHSSHDSHHTPAPSYCPNRPCRLAPRSWKALKYDKTLKVNFCLLVFAVRTAERGWNPIK